MTRCTEIFVTPPTGSQPAPYLEASDLLTKVKVQTRGKDGTLKGPEPKESRPLLPLRLHDGTQISVTPPTGRQTTPDVEASDLFESVQTSIRATEEAPLDSTPQAPRHHLLLRPRGGKQILG